MDAQRGNPWEKDVKPEHRLTDVSFVTKVTDTCTSMNYNVY